MTKEEFLARKAAIAAESEILWGGISVHRAEEKRLIKVLGSADEILERLDKTFEEKTALTPTDTKILMLATALQLVRIYLLPKLEKVSDTPRIDHDDASIKKMQHDEIEKYKAKHAQRGTKESKKGYRSWQEIAFTKKVPYDATRHSGEGFYGINMHGGFHRVKTLGHDPILGWVFGVANIISDTITICPEYGTAEKSFPIPYLMSYKVDMGSNFCWTERTSTISVFKDCLESISEDKNRLLAAFFAQGLHLKSDKYTKLGLPVPFLTLLDADEAYEIYKGGYDYLDFVNDMRPIKRFVNSASQTMMINSIIGLLHKFFYNPNTDYNQALYDVRTRKIILYSDVIATSSDVLQTAIRASLNDDSAVKNLDFGGLIVTLWRLLSDTKYIMKVKEEFIFNEWDRIVQSENNIYNI